MAYQGDFLDGDSSLTELGADLARKDGPPIPGSLHAKGELGCGQEGLRAGRGVLKKGALFASTDPSAVQQVPSSQEKAALTTACLKKRKKCLVALCHPEKAVFGSHHVPYMASAVITGVPCLFETTTRAMDPSFAVTIDAPTVEECPPSGTPAFVALTGARIGPLTPPVPPPCPAHADSVGEPGGGPRGGDPGGSGLRAGALEVGGGNGRP